MDAITLHIQPDLTYTLEGDQALLDSWLELHKVTDGDLANILLNAISNAKAYSAVRDLHLSEVTIAHIMAYPKFAIIRDYDAGLIIFGAKAY